MLNMRDINAQASNDARQTAIGQETPPATLRLSWPMRAIHIAQRYPIPLVTLILMLVSLGLWLAGRALFADWALLAVTVIGGVPLLWQTTRQLIHREFGVDALALLAIIGSILLREYLAGALIVLMLSGGEALEAFALRRARSSLSALMERAPREAHIWREGALVTIPADAVEVGMEVAIKPGEIIPVDGVVVSGAASVSEAELTGEPVPVRKEPGMIVLSGSVDLDGALGARATKRSAESQYAQIVRLVEQAQSRKAPIHRLADRYSVWFTIAAVALAGAAWALSGDSVYALAVLVCASPCPLILATPIAIMSGIDLAARNGLIVKSGGAMEQLGEVDVAVFDKTGTLTLGAPRVTAIVRADAPDAASELDSANHDQMTLLRFAASVEQLSTHILSRAVVEAARGRSAPLSPVENFDERFGKGVSGRIAVNAADRQGAWANLGASVEIAIGNRSFMRNLDIPLPEALLAERERRVELGQIGSFIAVDRRAVGLIVLRDTPRAELARLADELRQAGIKESVLLTGDGEVVAQQIGRLAQIDRVVARCLPEDKVRVVQELERQGRRALMVGDGINDAPALASATVGMALGAQGLTAAASAADTVLLSTDILRVPRAVRLGRRVMRIALQGIWVGMGLSGLAMLIAAFGFITPAAGALIQEGFDVIVILNALRVGRTTF